MPIIFGTVELTQQNIDDDWCHGVNAEWGLFDFSDSETLISRLTFVTVYHRTSDTATSGFPAAMPSCDKQLMTAKLGSETMPEGPEENFERVSLFWILQTVCISRYMLML